jgi:hypothetical protein
MKGGASIESVESGGISTLHTHAHTHAHTHIHAHVQTTHSSGRTATTDETVGHTDSE